MIIEKTLKHISQQIQRSHKKSKKSSDLISWSYRFYAYANLQYIRGDVCIEILILKKSISYHAFYTGSQWIVYWRQGFKNQIQLAVTGLHRTSLVWLVYQFLYCAMVYYEYRRGVWNTAKGVGGKPLGRRRVIQIKLCLAVYLGKKNLSFWWPFS